MKVLQVIDQAFRTTVEEQDDTILWLSQSMRGAGADLIILLSGHAVCYAVQSQAQPTLRLGQWQQQQPAKIVADIVRLNESNTPVYAITEDLDERGLGQLALQHGVERLSRDSLVDLYERVDQVWHW